MYTPDGNEYLVHMKDPGGLLLTLTIDEEDYARLLNEGWTVIEETERFYREPLTEEMFRQATGRQTGNDHVNINA
jgi:hypothetical protein